MKHIVAITSKPSYAESSVTVQELLSVISSILIAVGTVITNKNSMPDDPYDWSTS